MNVILTCSACAYKEVGSSQKMLMNKIIMWNHTKKEHPYVAERILRTCERVPDDIYGMRPALGAAL